MVREETSRLQSWSERVLFFFRKFSLDPLQKMWEVQKGPVFKLRDITDLEVKGIIKVVCGDVEI